MQIGANGTGGAQMGQEPEGAMKRHWLSSLRAVGLAGVLGLLVSGCSSYNPLDWGDDDTARPEQIAIPAEEAAEQGTLPEGLAGDTGRDYDKSESRKDVTVVRPLRSDTNPPKVTVGVQGDPEAATVNSVTADKTDLPGEPPVLGQDDAANATPAKEHDSDGSVLVDAPNIDAMQGLDAFQAQSYGVSFLAATIPFNHGSAHLSATDVAMLKQVVAQFKDSGGAITVVGHASSRTGDMNPVEHKLANFDISVKRAQVVARALRKLGVPNASLYVGAVSDNEPMYQEVMPAGEAGNRRTEVFLNQ